MPYDIIIGRNEPDRIKYGKSGLINIGKSFVKMGQTTSLANNILLDIAKAHVILVCGKRGSGKCLHEDTLINLSDGSQTPIKKLECNTEKIISLNERLKLESVERTEFFARGVDRLMKVRLRSGKEIKLTPEHPLLTIKGWQPIQDLKIGDRIATPRKSFFGNEDIPQHKIKLLAYLIAEGHTKKVILFSNSDEEIVKDFEHALKNFDPSLRLIKEKKGCYRVSSPNWKNKVIDTSKIRFNKEKRCFDKGNYVIIEKRSIRKFIEEYNLYGKLSKEKIIPESIIKLKKEPLALFLNRLFSCDGSIYKTNGYWEISYSSSSKKLIEQVNSLLLKFGILAKLRNKFVRYNKKIFKSFELVLNSENAVKFIEEIGFFGQKHKKEFLAKLEILLKIRNHNVDTIPKEIWETFRPKNWAEIGRFIGYRYPKAMRERIRYSPSRGTLLQIAQAEQNSALYLLATSDIFWDEIISMELLEGKFKVYDICVPQLHNFVANDIIVHNSYSLSVIAEEISRMPEDIRENISVLMFDTMGIFWTMKFPNKRDEKMLSQWGMKPQAINTDIYVPMGYYQEYKNRGIPADYSFALKPTELSAGEWCNVFDVKMTDPIGVLIEKTIAGLNESEKEYSIKDIIAKISADTKIEKNIKDATENRFIAADSWGLFSDKGLEINDLIAPGKISIVDVSCYTSVAGSWSIKNLVIGLLCKKIINNRIGTRKFEELETIELEGKYFTEEKKRDLPMVWIAIDEVHESLRKNEITPATDALLQLLREGRQPGISMLLATQQPGEIHKDVITQSDIVISHRLTAKVDIAALNDMMQTYLLGDIQKYLNEMPKASGSAIILDDNSERIYPMKVHPKLSWHGGETPSAVKIKKQLELDL